MAEQKENIKVRKASEDKYVITRTIEEEVGKEEFQKIFGDITKGLEEVEKNLADIPIQVEARTKILRKDIETLGKRKEVFEPLISKIIQEEAKKETPQTTGTG